MSFVFIVFRLIDRTKMRTIVLFVKCFWKKLFGINKSAVFDPYIKHKKTPGLLVCRPGVLISSRDFPAESRGTTL